MQLFRGEKHQDIPRKWQNAELAEWLWNETENQLKIKGITL
jgi:hypothetical protein